jgi:phospholipid-binding lipoprotein MlaA
MTGRNSPIGRRSAPLRYAGLALASALVATGASAEPAATPPGNAATAGATTAVTAYDPWQPVNRPLFALGMGIDRVVIAPITHGYMAVTPQPVRNRVSAFVYNLGEPSTAIEDVLQGYPRRAGRTAVRFVVNTTVGLLGLFDVASHMGLEGHGSDFGQTLGRYGAQPGPYIYLPVVGPLNLRDGVGRVVDTVTDPIGFVTGPITSTGGAARYSVEAIDNRARGDGAFEALKDATDPYATTRSAYSQYREAVVQAATGAAPTLPDFEPAPTPEPGPPATP